MSSTKTERIEHLKWISLPVTIGNFPNSYYIYFVLNSAHSSGKKNNRKCDSQELFENKLVAYFVLHYSRKRFFRKGFDPEIYVVAYGNLTRLGFLFSRTQ